MSSVVTACWLAAGRHNGGTTDCHSLAIGSAPIAVNCIRNDRLNKTKQNDTYRSGKIKHPLAA